MARKGIKIPREYQAMLLLTGAALLVLWLATRDREDGDTLLGQFAEDLAKVALVLVAGFALFQAPWWLGGAAAGAVLRTTIAGAALSSLVFQAFGSDRDQGGSGGSGDDPCARAGKGRTVLTTTDPQGKPLHRCTDGTLIGG